MDSVSRSDTATSYRDFARAVDTVVQYAEGDIIVREGDAADCMYVVLDSTVVIGSHDKNIKVIASRMSLGFLGVIDGLPPTTTARTKGQCELALLDRRRFRYMVE